MTTHTITALTTAALPPGGERLPVHAEAHPTRGFFARKTGVRLATLLSPKRAGDVARVSMWQAPNGRATYRASSGQDEGAAFPVPFGQPGSCQGAVLPGATYTVWTASRPIRSPPSPRPTTYVWWARLERLPTMTEDYAATLLRQAFLPPSLVKRAAPVLARLHEGSDAPFATEADGAVATGQLAAAKRAMARMHAALNNNKTAVWALETNSLYWRVWACPLLFRLWPTKTLRALPWTSFCALAELVTTASHPTPFMFRWVLGERLNGALPMLDLSRVLLWRTLRGPAQPWQWPASVDERAHPHLLALLHVLQRAFTQTVHTYLTPEQLADAYFDRLGMARLPHGLKEALAEGGTQTVQMLTKRALPNWLRDTPGLWAAASTLGVTVAATQPVIAKTKRYWCRASRLHKSEEAWTTAPEAVLYPAYLYELEEEVAQDLNALLAKFDPDVQADGCSTMADVRARIAAAEPPAHSVELGAPAWDSPDFQAKWATCDPSQQQAVARAVLHPLTIVDGRPGYGKTYVGEVVAALFPRDQGCTLPLAAYGRIAALLKARLGDGWTFHKAAALVRGASTPKALKRLLQTAATGIWDELSLHLLQHWGLVLSVLFGLRRLVLMGDIEQMPGIGAGTVIGSLLRRYRSTDAYTRLQCPHRYMSSRAEALAVGANGGVLTERPASVFEGAAVVWNMQELTRFYAAPDRYVPDLLYGTSWADVERGARFVVLPPQGGLEETLTPVAKHFFAGEAALLRTRVPQADQATVGAVALPVVSPLQLLAHRSVHINKVNETLRALVYKNQTAQYAHFYVGECVTFLKNAYFTRDGAPRHDPETVLGEPLAPRQIAAVAVADDGEEAVDEEEEVAESADPAEPEGELSDRSFNVMNGQVRRIVAIVDVARVPVAVRTDEVTARHEESGRPQKRARTTAAEGAGETKVVRVAAQYRTGGKLAPQAQYRLLVFSDGTQLNVTRDYDLKNVRPAATTTVNKAQGGEYDDVQFLHELFDRESGGHAASQHVNRELLHTAQTRAQRCFVWHGTLEAYLDVHRSQAPLRQERFAEKLDFDPGPARE